MINGLSFDVGNGMLRVGNVPENLMASRCCGDTDSKRSVERLLRLLKEYACSATFFIMGSFAEKNRALVRRIAAEGHEIASLGYRLEAVERLTRYSFRNDAARSKRVLEEISGKDVVGYRLPGFALSDETLWTIGILGELGFKYDSSISPKAIPVRYRFGRETGESFTFENGLREFPLTAYRFLRVHFMLSGGVYFRLIPALFSRILLRLINGEGRRFIYCLDPAELGNWARENAGRHYRRMHRAERRLRRLLGHFEFQPLNQFLAAGCGHERRRMLSVV